MAKKTPETPNKKKRTDTDETKPASTHDEKKGKNAAQAKSPQSAEATSDVQGSKKQPKKPTSFIGKLLTPLRAMGRYFKGAWYELRQVQWPTRRATWGLTIAVLCFTGFYVVLIMGLDFLFQQLFERILL